MQPSDHPREADSAFDRSGNSGPGSPSEWSSGWPSGWNVTEVAETGSTNADLIAGHLELPDRTVLRADHQTAGRGRLDRRWEAPPGSNLLASILFRVVPADPGELLRRLGLAAVHAVRPLTSSEVALKWPNDVLLDDLKLAGLLAQRADDGSVVVGIGLNVGWAPDGASKLGGELRPVQVLGAILEAFDALPLDIDALYRDELATLGKRVRVELPNGDIVGTAVDVERDGRLVVLDECAISHRLAIGDIVHLRPA